MRRAKEFSEYHGDRIVLLFPLLMTGSDFVPMVVSFSGSELRREARLQSPEMP